MKKNLMIMIAVVCTVALQAQKQYRVEDIPNVQLTDRTRFVSNPDGILSPTSVGQIDNTLYALKESGRAQVVVIAVNSIGDADPFDFLQRLLMQWGVGRKDSDDGLGILFVMDQRTIEIQTGYGLEGDLPDALVNRVIDTYMIPQFRQDNWDQGMIDGVTAINEVLNGRTPQDLETTDDAFPWFFFFFIFGIPVLIMILAWIFGGRCPRCHKKTLKRIDSKEISNINGRRVVEETYKCSNCGYMMTRQRSEGGPSGGSIIGGGLGGGVIGGMGGFGGGRSGGGFGGGSFGGGGARGRF